MEKRPNDKSLFGKGLRMLLEPAPIYESQRSYLLTRSTPSVGSRHSYPGDDPDLLFDKARRLALGNGCRIDFAGAQHLLDRILQMRTTHFELRKKTLIVNAIHFIDGLGVKADPNRALQLLSELARIDSGEGGFNLGLFFEGRFGPLRPLTANTDLAAFFYACSARKGDLRGQTNLALLHIENRLTHCNAAFGWSLLRDSAKRGDQVAVEAIQELNR